MLSCPENIGLSGPKKQRNNKNKNRKKAKQESLDGHEAEHDGTEANNYNFDQNCNHYDKTNKEKSR